ncbi:MAG TPA: hypothetical protein VF691_13515 [Cytophagaceae bacterium]|jgi:hypothetical protein
MNSTQTLYFAVTFALLIIGVHQTYLHGFLNSYWIFMLVIIIMGIFQYNKNKKGAGEKGGVAEKDPVKRNLSATGKRKRKRS